jgi:hypothetical protein
MGLQSNVQTTIAYKAETVFGTAPGATAAKYLRRVSSGLNTNKDTFASAEVRSDQQVADMRHGGRSARGNVEGELSTVTYDDFFEAALRGTWAAGVSATNADFATGMTIATSGSTSTLTFVGAGNLLTKGFKVGDVVRLSGATNPANNGRNLRIVALTSLVMTVAGVLVTTGQQASGWTVAVAGRKLTMGTTKRSFTLEQAMADAATYELFTGMRVGGFTLGVQPNGMTSVGWEFQGQNGVANATGYFTTPAAEGTTGVVSGIDGALRLNGVEQAIVTGLQVNFTNNLSASPVIGSVVVPDIFYGSMVCTGSVSAYIENADLLNAFLNETEVDLVAQLQASGTAPQDFLAFNMQRVKLSGATKTIGPDGGVIAQFPFQALLKTGGAGTAFDNSTLTIQRSNA